MPYDANGLPVELVNLVIKDGYMRGVSEFSKHFQRLKRIDELDRFPHWIFKWFLDNYYNIMSIPEGDYMKAKDEYDK